MLTNWQQKLIVRNILVFIAILVIFGISVHIISTTSFRQQLEEKLITVADSAISSIDYDHAKGDAIPDLIVSVLPDAASPSLSKMRLQWFTPEGKMVIEKGTMSVSCELVRSTVFQSQQDPPALVYTKPAVADGKLLGYVRVGHPLDKLQKLNMLLLQSICLGMLTASIATIFGVRLLVRESLKPVNEVILKLQQFCADAAHEMRNPITAVKTNASVTLRHSTYLTEQDRQRLENILSGAEQLQSLTNSLLILAKIEKDIEEATAVECEWLELHDLAEQILVQAQSRNKKQLTCTNAIPTDLKLFMDRESIECVLRNLISNAIRYTPDGGTVKVTGCRVSDAVQLVVQDSGIGISKQDLEHIFDRFWRADKARNYESNGTGLGLAIVKAIVEKFGGRISVESELDQGTKFAVEFRSIKR